MARTAVEIRPIYDKAGTEVDKWYELGQNDWSHEEGTVRSPPSVLVCANMAKAFLAPACLLRPLARQEKGMI